MKNLFIEVTVDVPTIHTLETVSHEKQMVDRVEVTARNGTRWVLEPEVNGGIRLSKQNAPTMAIRILPESSNQLLLF